MLYIIGLIAMAVSIVVVLVIVWAIVEELWKSTVSVIQSLFGD